MRRWIGLAGNKEAGKDTAARAFIQRGYQKIAFADPLRRMALALDPFLLPPFCHGEMVANRLSGAVECAGWDNAKRHPEVRRILQRLGTEAGRRVLGESIWVDAAAKAAAGLDKVIFTDVRFDNEAAFIVKNGGLIIRVVRPGKNGDGHTSEMGVSGHLVHATVLNDSTPESLWRQVLEVSR